MNRSVFAALFFAAAALAQLPVDGGGSGGGGSANYKFVVPNTTTTQTVTAAQHRNGHAALLVQCYTSATPAVPLIAVASGPAAGQFSYTVHPTTFDVAITFASGGNNGGFCTINGSGQGIPGADGGAFSIDDQTVTAVKDDSADEVAIHSASDDAIRKMTLQNLLKGLSLLNMTMAYDTPPTWATPGGSVPTNMKTGHKVEFGGTFASDVYKKDTLGSGVGGYTTIPSSSVFAGSAAGVTGQAAGGSSATAGTGVLGTANPATGNTAGVTGVVGLGESCDESRDPGSIACPGVTIPNLTNVVGGQFGTNNDSSSTTNRYSLMLTTGGTQAGSAKDAALGIPAVPSGARKHVYGVRVDAGSVDYALRLGEVDTGNNKASSAIHLFSTDSGGTQRQGSIDQSAGGIMRFIVPSGLSAQISDGTATLSLSPSTIQNGIPLFATGTPSMLSTTGTGNVVRATSPTLTTPTIADYTNATHDHSADNKGSQLTTGAIVAGSLQGNGTKFQLAGTIGGATGDALCKDANGNTTTTCGGSASFATLTATTSIDASAAAFLRIPAQTGGAPTAECDEASEVGKLRVRSTDPATANGTMHICRQTGTSTYGWQPVYGGAGTTPPVTCSVNQMFFDTDATAGSNLLLCTATNTWTAISGGGGGGTATVQDEGSNTSTTVTTYNFVGSGVTASGSGSTATITIPGGGVSNFAVSTTAGTDTIAVANTSSVPFATGDTVNVIAAASNRTFVPSSGTCTARFYEQGGTLKVAVNVTGGCDGTATNLTKVDADAFPANVNPIATVSISGGNLVDDSEVDLQTVFKAQKTITAGSGIDVTESASGIEIAATGGAGVTDGDKGEISVSGGVWTIDNNAVTTAKILDANVTSAKINDKAVGPAKVASAVVNETGTTYTYLDSNRAKLVTHTNASAIAGTLPQAGASSEFVAGWYMDVQNRGAGTLTITPTTSTIDGAASLALTTNQGARIFSDGTNYFTQRGVSGTSGANPAGSGTELQYRSGASTFGAVTSSSVSGKNITIDGTVTAGDNARIAINDDATGGWVRGTDQFANNVYMRAKDSAVQNGIWEFSTSLSDSGVQLWPKGGIRLNAPAAAPTCSSSARGLLWMVPGAAGASDVLQMCMKAAADTYAWRTIFTAP